MRYKKVLLVCPRFIVGRNRQAHFPLIGLGYIAEALQNAGIEVNILDMNLGYDFRGLKRKIEGFRPDIIGFTGMTLGYKTFYALIDRVKTLFPNIKIVVGGAHLSAIREKFLQECKGVDYGIILEGDISMAKLCLGDPPETIKGLIYRNNSEIITNEFESFVGNLDNLPFPKFEAFELNKYPLKQICIVTSRGCPYSCIYCSVGVSIGKNFRTKSAQNVAGEIEYWYKKGYRHIFILDDNFTLVYERVAQICDLLIKKSLKDLHLKNPAGLRADRVDRKLLEALKKVGFDMIAFGVESGSNKVLKNIMKGEDIEVIDARIKEACELGFDVDLFFLVGSPGETIKDLRISFDLAQRYPVRRAVFYNLIPLPGTELLKSLNEKNYLIQPIEYILNNASYYKNQPCFYTPEMSVQERKVAFMMAQKVSYSVRRNFIESKIKGPVFLKKFFSSFYATPWAEDIVNNHRIVLWGKEFIKKNFLR